MPSPRLAVLAPGQGAQTPGMLSAWAELPRARARLDAIAAAIDLDLLTLGTTGSAEDVRPTQLTQPLLFALAIAAAGEVFTDLPLRAPTVVAGHSIGEWASATLGGALPVEVAAHLVGVRGRAMGEAADATPSAMAALLGGDAGEVEKGLAEHGLWPANVNGAGQIVAAGPADAVDRLVASPPGGARVRKLDVAAAFHTPLMEAAVAILRDATSSAVPADPTAVFVGNLGGELVTSGAALVDDLVAQVSRPVRFDLVCARLGELGVTGVLELPPAGVLTGLVKRQLPGVATFALKSPADLDAARSFVAEHGVHT